MKFDWFPPGSEDVHVYLYIRKFIAHAKIEQKNLVSRKNERVACARTLQLYSTA